ncbi:N-acetylneuraminate lyase [Ornithinibacillus halophilus]|uniref:N-acetylneuraminate lyase n=1 Tax=Ornithinibacillus halophilus TaxID=930117 RepID=A0A1M5HMB0_9BACI|nr:N-acetylneuraminate lyase [Ornithinibacillus halophilus]SHG16972.1 N-acetylneuraminate lyase [Ornithinibacillus halophilus]
MNGIMTALLTPFNEDGTLNEKGLREVVRYNIDEMKVNGLYVGGSTGEAFLMDESTRKEVLRIVKSEAGSDVTLIAQIGSLNIEEAVRLGNEAKELGFDALSAITPYYYKFSFEEIKSYYQRITEETNHPMIVYSIPVLTGTEITIENYGELLALPNVIGVKYSDTNLSKLTKLKELHPDKVFFGGADDMLLQFAVSGADGAIGSTYSLLGKEANGVFNAVQTSSLQEARDLQNRMNKVISILEDVGVYQSIKHVLKQNGIDGGYMKFPFREISAEEKKEAEKIIDILSSGE